VLKTRVFGPNGSQTDLKSNMTWCPVSLSVLPATLPLCPSRAPIETSAEPTRPNRHRSTHHMQERPADARSWLCPPPTRSHTTLFWPARMASQRVDGMVGLRLPAPPLTATGFGSAAREQRTKVDSAHRERER
jgi:hypothetical protein